MFFTTITTTIILASATSTLSPGGPKLTLPGVSLLRSVATDGTGAVAVLAVIGCLISAAAMSIGHHSSNGRLADKGRTGLIASILAGVVAGGAWAIIAFAVSAGGKV
jgi:hypothetical protein